MEIGPRKSFQRPPSVHANRGSIGSVLAIRRVDVRGGRMGLPREEGGARTSVGEAQPLPRRFYAERKSKGKTMLACRL